MEPVGPGNSSPMDAEGESSAAADIPNTLADGIAKLVLDQFAALTNGLTSQFARRKVLAGIVMTRYESADGLEGAQVIAVTTGTKCIGGEYMSDSGLALNDCHAEIIARRCLRRFLFDQIELHLDPAAAGMSVLVPRNNGAGFVLKSGVRFHLYVSSAPCGDARIFAPKETESEAVEDRHPNRMARGLLRTKIESGEGTIPITKSTVELQTWDGVMSGERLLTMCCSDKVARWNVLGIQGREKYHFSISSSYVACSTYRYLIRVKRSILKMYSVYNLAL